MRWRPVCSAAALLALAIAAAPRTAVAQCDSCRIVRLNPDSSLVIDVGGRRYRALTEQQQRDVLALAARAERAEGLVALKDSLIAGSETLLAVYDSTLAQQRAYTATLDSLYRGYRDLAAGYRRLSGEPILTAQLGAGITGPDTKPALVAGVGVWRFRLSGFFQEDNSGVLAGVQWKLF
jgi:hypothetical protein